MIKIKLRGGNGELVQAQTTSVKPRLVLAANAPIDYDAIRKQREAQFELEAEQEARAVSRHRQMTPARERKFMTV
jgi:hypothetical protein